MPGAGGSPRASTRHNNLPHDVRADPGRPAHVGRQNPARVDGSRVPSEDIDLDRLAAEVAGTLPSLNADERRVGVTVYRLLAAGEPTTPEYIARHSGIAYRRVAAVVEQLPTATVVDGAVTAFLGLRRGTGRHRLQFAGRSLATWCAWDTLFLPELIGRPARAESRCPVTGDAITLEVDPTLGVTRSSPADTRLSFLAHPAPFAGDVAVGFCRWIHFLSGPLAARAWLSGTAWPGGEGDTPDRPEVIVVSLSAGVELGRRTNMLVFGDPN